MVNQKIKPLLTKEQIQEKVVQLGAQITKDFDTNQELVCICILKGSVIFFADLIRQINLELTIDFMRVSSYGNELSSSGDVKINKDLSSSIKGKHILLIEDIVDTGITLSFLKDLLQSREPASIKICSLLHKPTNSHTNVAIDYLGFTIDNHFVVGYGLDAAEKYRNLDYVGIYPQEDPTP